MCHGRSLGDFLVVAGNAICLPSPFASLCAFGVKFRFVLRIGRIIFPDMAEPSATDRALRQLISDGAMLDFFNRDSALRVGAAEWLPGHGLLFAELGAQHQGHVHLVTARTLRGDARSLDIIGPDGGRVATFRPATAEEIPRSALRTWQQITAGDDWGRFWASEIKNYTTPPESEE